MEDRDRDRFGLPEVSQNTSFSEEYEMEQPRDPTGDLSDTLWDMIGRLQQEIQGLGGILNLSPTTNMNSVGGRRLDIDQQHHLVGASSGDSVEPQVVRATVPSWREVSMGTYAPVSMGIGAQPDSTSMGVASGGSMGPNTVGAALPRRNPVSMGTREQQTGFGSMGVNLGGSMESMTASTPALRQYPVSMEAGAETDFAPVEVKSRGSMGPHSSRTMMSNQHRVSMETGRRPGFTSMGEKLGGSMEQQTAGTTGPRWWPDSMETGRCPGFASMGEKLGGSMEPQTPGATGPSWRPDSMETGGYTRSSPMGHQTWGSMEHLTDRAARPICHPSDYVDTRTRPQPRSMGWEGRRGEDHLHDGDVPGWHPEFMGAGATPKASFRGMRSDGDVEDKRDLPRWHADPMGFAVEPQFGPMGPNLKASVAGPSQTLGVNKRNTNSVNPAPVDYILQRRGPWDPKKQPTLPDYSANPMGFGADVHQGMHPELSSFPSGQQEMACKRSTSRMENPEDLHRQNVMKKIQEAKAFITTALDHIASSQAEISHWETVLQVQQHFRPASQRNPHEPGTDSKEVLLDDGWISARQFGPEQTQITSPEEQRITGENLRHESIIPQPTEEKYVCETYSPHVPQWKNKKPGTFDGTGSFKDYMVQFEMIAALNNWSERTKALELATSLRKTALGVLTDLNDDTRYDFQALVSALSTRFEPEDQAEVFKAQLRNRRRKKTESIPELGQDMKRLARLAYPGVMMEMKSWLALKCFVDALDNEFMEFQ